MTTEDSGATPSLRGWVIAASIGVPAVVVGVVLTWALSPDPTPPASSSQESPYYTDFGTDPEWATDSQQDFHHVRGGYRVVSRNESPSREAPTRYAFKHVPYGGGSFGLKWKIRFERITWSSGITFGLFDKSLSYLDGCFCVEVSRADRGVFLVVRVGPAVVVSKPIDIQDGREYLFHLTYDENARRLTLVVQDHRGHELENLEKPSPVPASDLTRLGFTRSPFGRRNYNGVDRFAVAEAVLRMVEFKWD